MDVSEPRAGIASESSAIDLPDSRAAIGPIRAFGRLLKGAVRWHSLRGGWLLDHLAHHRPFRLEAVSGAAPIEIMVAVVDHFEPGTRDGDEATAAYVASWCEEYRRIASRHRDADGRPPQHTWFHRMEYLNPDCIRPLSNEAFRGFGEVEFHLHHGHDTQETFEAKLRAGLDLGNRFGAMLTAEPQPRRRFAYIAGNWSLDNGSRDPAKSGCDTELTALRAAGCYADFTFPGLGSHAQPRTANAIYYATDDPRPKSYDTGIDVAVGRPASGDLMIIQGPLVLDWRFGRYEASDLEDYSPPAPERLEPWLRANIHVAGRPEWIFVKLHTHGLQSHAGFLGPGLDAMLDAMEAHWNRPPFRLHYVTAREMYNIIKAAEAGHAGDPNRYRDFAVPQPANRRIHCDRPWELETFGPDLIRLSVQEPGPAAIEFRSGPLRRASGWIRRLEARFRAGAIDSVDIDGQGPFDVETVEDGAPPRCFTAASVTDPHG